MEREKNIAQDLRDNPEQCVDAPHRFLYDDLQRAVSSVG
jgi:hypothetical protein